jgi:hypothetical protein
MITLGSDCLLFQMANGESIPYSASMISIELMGETAQLFEAEFVQHAAQAVFHYFRAELGRQKVTVGEFAEALEKVLKGFRLSAAAPKPVQPASRMVESDLARLANESGSGCELLFFPRLRDELRQQLSRSPRLVRFRGLRSCVKQLVGAQRWSSRCSSVEEHIVTYLRECLSAERKSEELALLVD